MNALVQSLPATVLVDTGVAPAEPTSGNLSPVEGAALRSFKVLLTQLDPARTFAGLTRVLSPSGEYLWVCPRHRRLYDPGLPVLPR
jgi:hypothetical protein